MASRFASKIRATAAGRRPLGLGSFGDLGPGSPAIDEWRAMGLEVPDVAAMRRYRLERIIAELESRRYDGLLVTDPINVRYATDSTNMVLWSMHNAVRFAYVSVDGYVIVWDFHGSAHLSEHLDLVDEIRHAPSLAYFDTAHDPDAWDRWASEVRSAMQGGTRLAIDAVGPRETDSLRRLGIEVFDGFEVCEQARLVKSDDEIRAMRCAIAAAEAGIAEMHRNLRPGVTEQELWSHLHQANIVRGGEWIETRLLASGWRTKPWFAECSSKVIESGELVAFDTDLIGPYGYCADISRTWLCGDGDPTDEQSDLFSIAVEQIRHNIALLGPGITYLEFAGRAFDLPERYRPNRYSVVLHGVGLCDEYPAIYYSEDAAHAYDGIFEPGMTVCVESYVGAPDGREGVKLEEQVLITDTSTEVLSTHPLDLRLEA